MFFRFSFQIRKKQYNITVYFSFRRVHFINLYLKFQKTLFSKHCYEHCKNYDWSILRTEKILENNYTHEFLDICPVNSCRWFISPKSSISQIF
jgi:hypothetical protein